ncbi:hypothetical protein DERF_012084 [Dermatophagoides farinae]|uniref:Oligopeptide transporter 1 n=1 Tax=Dermatophagoides farinae TaxID=6954 RepID=A0A922HR60_DERFA|nr:hypothetical protein DERF_012084 [Dermatophagoides farinae]
MDKNNNEISMSSMKKDPNEYSDDHHDVVKKPTKPLPYPKSVIFIIGNEFCERFSFYGMRTILILYLMNRLSYEENAATMAFHLFAMACYFTPLAGAILADTILGKYWTILIISCIYVAGSVVIALSSISGSNPLTLIGLALIAIGTGGIKPCVAAFGGDQFIRGQEQQLQRFFSFFYIAINSGSLISTFLTPILREDVGCMGRSDCYPLAFGIPAILMIGALVLFVVGRFWTGYRVVPRQKQNIIITVCKCVYHALMGKFSPSTLKREHWLDHADLHYDRHTILEVKTLMRILFLYISLPIFWALFDQQSSRWTLQAIRLNGDFGFYTIKPDQIQVINPILIISFIPIFQNIIYPIFDRIGLNKPLRRMVVGGLFASLSFTACGILQTQIEQKLPPIMDSGTNHLMLIQNNSHHHIDSMNMSIFNELDSRIKFNQDSLKIYTSIERTTLMDTFIVPNDLNISLKDDQTLVIYCDNQDNGEQSIQQPMPLIFVLDDNVLSKPHGSGAQMFTIFNLNNFNNETFSSTDTNDNVVIDTIYQQYEQNSTTNVPTIGILKPFEVEVKGKSSYMNVGHAQTEYKLDQGATYIQLIAGDMAEVDKINFKLIQLIDGNNISVLWQLFQYMLITAAEIMFSVTGLEFSYSQAPKSMKSVIQAAWLLNVTIGNLLVAIIADVKLFPKQSMEFFFFAILMLIDIGIFATQAYFYVPYKGRDSTGQHYDSEPYDNDDGRRSRVWSMVSAEGELPKLNPVILDDNEYDHNATWTSRTSRTRI